MQVPVSVNYFMARIISRCASEFSFASVVVLSRKEDIEGVFLYSFVGQTNCRTLLRLNGSSLLLQQSVRVQRPEGSCIPNYLPFCPATGAVFLEVTDPSGSQGR